MTEFNAGDVVRYLGNGVVGEFTTNKLYVVKDYDRFGYVIVEKDDKGSTSNCLTPNHLELVRRKGEFKVGDIVSWGDIDYWQNATVRGVTEHGIYADSNNRNTETGDGLFPKDDKNFELTLITPVEDCKTFMTLNSEGKVLLNTTTFNFFADGGYTGVYTKPEVKNHELTVNEARAIADEIDDSIVNVIAVYDELIKQGFKITKD